MTNSDVPPMRHVVHDGKDLVLFLGGGGLFAVLVGTWSWGQTAALLRCGHLVSESLPDTWLVIAGMGPHWNNPRLAWPPQARGCLPGPIGFYLAGLVLAVVVAVLAVVALWTWSRWRRRDDGFATRRELALSLSERAVCARGAIVRPSLAGRRFALRDVGVPLGVTTSGVRLAASAEDSVLVLAAPRQGKTSQVAIPWLHHWPGPALVTSVRRDVLLATAILRRPLGPVLVMAPTRMAGWPHMLTWSPAAGCQDLNKARKRAELMVTVGRAEKEDSNNAGYFGANATNLLMLWLHAAAIARRSMREVLRWSLDDQDDTPIRLLAGQPGAAPGTAELLDGLYRTPPETKSGLWTTVQTALAPLLSSSAQATFAPEGDGLDLAAFLRVNGTIYLLVAEQQATALAPLIAAFVDALVETAKQLADASPGGRLDPPLALILDEVANVAPLPSLPSLMSFAGGTGIFVTAILQSRAQAEARFGPEAAAMLWGAATVKLILGGLAGHELRDLSELVGEYDRHLTTFQRSDDGAVTTSTSIQERRAIRPEQIRTLRPDRREALVIHATTPAVRVRMTRHYESPDRQLYENAQRQARSLLDACERRARQEETRELTE